MLMNARTVALIAGVLVTTLSGVAGAPQGAETARPAAAAAQAQWRTLAGTQRDAEATDALLRRLMGEYGVTALSVAVVDAGRTVFERTLGMVDPATGKRADATTVFRAASLTKPVFAYLVMKLADEGVLDLDTPVHRYLKQPLPAYPAYASFRDDARYERLTARLLLSHQGGLPNWRRVRPDGPIEFHSNPGDRFAYSGEGYALLQFVIENITGRDLATLARDKVFVPLGMNDTSFLWERRFDGRFAVELQSGIGRFIACTREKGNAAGSIVTNASDYAKFLGAVLNGTGLKPGTRAVMLEPQVALTSKSLFSPPGTDGGANVAHKMAWAAGWGRFEDSYGPALFHVGREEGCENYVQASLDRRLGVAIFSRTTNLRSFSAPLVDYTIDGSFSPLEWLEHTDSLVPPAFRGTWRGLFFGLATLVVALVVLARGLRWLPTRRVTYPTSSLRPD